LPRLARFWCGRRQFIQHGCVPVFAVRADGRWRALEDAEKTGSAIRVRNRFQVRKEKGTRTFFRDLQSPRE
jgi:hypothetical protein